MAFNVDGWQFSSCCTVGGREGGTEWETEGGMEGGGVAQRCSKWQDQQIGKHFSLSFHLLSCSPPLQLHHCCPRFYDKSDSLRRLVSPSLLPSLPSSLPCHPLSGFLPFPDMHQMIASSEPRNKTAGDVVSFCPVKEKQIRQNKQSRWWSSRCSLIFPSLHCRVPVGRGRGGGGGGEGETGMKSTTHTSSAAALKTRTALLTTRQTMFSFLRTR